MTQEQAAEAAGGLHPTYWSEIETAKRNPTVRVAEHLAEALEVPIAALFEERAKL